MSFKMRRLYFNLSLVFLCVIFVKGENECGIIASTRSARIVGGEEIGFKYPWLATLVFTKDPKTIVCGGSLISKDYVLTAAHCYKPYISQKKQGKIQFEDIYNVKLGIDNQCREDENVGSYATKRVIIHEEYFQDLLFHDIALLNLDEEVNNFLPVCLPQIRYDDQERLKFKEGVIVGLGKERSTAWKLPCRVKEAVVPIQSDSNCRKMLENQQENPNRVLGAFCAGYIEGNIDTCQGDSGGPLQIKMEDSTFMLLGITSFGYGCARPDVYGMYTDVSYYIDWIHGNMKKTEVKTTNTNNTIPPPQKMRYRGFLSQLLNW